MELNPLLANRNYCYRILKISFFKNRRDHGKKFYEPRVYESVNNKSLSQAISHNLTGKRFHRLMGLKTIIITATEVSILLSFDWTK